MVSLQVPPYRMKSRARLTFFRTLEANVELLHVVVHQSDFVVAHQHLHDIGLDSALWARHFECSVLARLDSQTVECSDGGAGRLVCRSGVVKSRPGGGDCWLLDAGV